MRERFDEPAGARRAAPRTVRHGPAGWCVILALSLLLALLWAATSRTAQGTPLSRFRCVP